MNVKVCGEEEDLDFGRKADFLNCEKERAVLAGCAVPICISNQEIFPNCTSCVRVI